MGELEEPLAWNLERRGLWWLACAGALRGAAVPTFAFCNIAQGAPVDGAADAAHAASCFSLSLCPL